MDVFSCVFPPILMKKLTCKEMGGPCDAVFTGETSGDIAAAATKHIEELAKTDPRHQKTYDEMAAIAASPDRHDAWKKDFQKRFDSAPEA